MFTVNITYKVYPTRAGEERYGSKDWISKTFSTWEHAQDFMLTNLGRLNRRDVTHYGITYNNLSAD